MEHVALIIETNPEIFCEDALVKQILFLSSFIGNGAAQASFDVPFHIVYILGISILCL